MSSFNKEVIDVQVQYADEFVDFLFLGTWLLITWAIFSLISDSVWLLMFIAALRFFNSVVSTDPRAVRFPNPSPSVSSFEVVGSQIA